jgi:transketolase
MHNENQGVLAKPLDARSKQLRKLIVKALEGAGKGHVGSALAAVEILRVLYDDVMQYRRLDPSWADRDRCILSKGHACLALYAILADKGFIDIDELSGYTSATSRLGGCSESIVPGVEATTGALGHGLSVGAGMALAARIQGRKSRVFVVLGDGELDEGSVWEAALFATKHQLSNLVTIVDRNGLQIAGPTEEVTPLEPLKEKWMAFGFDTIEVDGHDLTQLRQTLANAGLAAGRPKAVICHTVKGKGIPLAENDFNWHWKGGIDGALVAKKIQVATAICASTV